MSAAVQQGGAHLQRHSKVGQVTWGTLGPGGTALCCQRLVQPATTQRRGKVGQTRGSRLVQPATTGCCRPHVYREAWLSACSCQSLIVTNITAFSADATDGLDNKLDRQIHVIRCCSFLWFPCLLPVPALPAHLAHRLPHSSLPGCAGNMQSLRLTRMSIHTGVRPPSHTKHTMRTSPPCCAPD